MLGEFSQLSSAHLPLVRLASFNPTDYLINLIFFDIQCLEKVDDTGISLIVNFLVKTGEKLMGGLMFDALHD